MGDEFKDSGKYFGEGEYVSLPIAIPNTDWTMEGWFIWLSGDGPLMEAERSEDWRIARDEGGKCTYRIGGTTRVTDLSVSKMRDSWIYLVLAKEGPVAKLYFNGELVDTWNGAPANATLSTCAAMRGAVGFAAHIAVYELGLTADTVTEHWDAGMGRV